MGPFQGLSAFPITPADPGGRVDAEALARLIERLVSAGVDSIGLLGSTGTYAYLSREERRRAVAAAVECADGRTPVIVGSGALRTDEAQALARDAEAAGADAVLLAPVSYTPLSEEEVFAHFQAVAGATGLPLCIYNNPTTTHFAFSDALIARLAQVANIGGVKMPLAKDGDFEGEIARLRQGAPMGFKVGYSGDWGCPTALLAGADAWYSVIGGLMPRSTLKLARAAQAGDAAEAAKLTAVFGPLFELFNQYGGLRIVYAAARHLGINRTDPPPPIQLPPHSEAPRIAAAIEAVQALED